VDDCCPPLSWHQAAWAGLRVARPRHPIAQAGLSPARPERSGGRRVTRRRYPPATRALITGTTRQGGRPYGRGFSGLADLADEIGSPRPEAPCCVADV